MLLVVLVLLVLMVVVVVMAAAAAAGAGSFGGGIGSGHGRGVGVGRPVSGVAMSVAGGTKLWIQSSMEPPNAHWMEGRHTPKLPTEWWSSRCKSAAWTLLGHQLMDNEIGGWVKRALLPDPDCHDAGYLSRLSFAALRLVFRMQK